MQLSQLLHFSDKSNIQRQIYEDYPLLVDQNGQQDYITIHSTSMYLRAACYKKTLTAVKQQCFKQ